MANHRILVGFGNLFFRIHRNASVNRPTMTYMHQVYADTKYRFEDLTRAKDDRDGQQERVWDLGIVSACR